MTAVSEQTLLDLVRETVAVVMSISADDLRLDTQLVDDLGVDSLALIEIVELSEDRLREQGVSVWVDDETLAQLVVLGDFVTALRAAVR